MTESITCVCGKTITKQYYSKHCESKWHINYINKDKLPIEPYKTPSYTRQAAKRYREKK